MQTEVLRLKCEDDYEVVVRTQDISYAWEKFRGRIDYTRRTNPNLAAPEAYCTYNSQDECELELYNPVTRLLEGLPKGKNWEEKWPVFYETCKYQVRIVFHGIDEDSKPEVRHVRKDVEDSFFCDEEKDKREKSLTGELDFLNEPGVFRLEFSYTKNGRQRDTFVSFDVVSPKLDTKNDYASLLREVNDEYQDVIYRYLSITIQQFSRGHLNNDATWMQAFQSIVDNYVKNVSRVIANPHSQIVKYRTSKRAEQIKYWTPEMEERLGEKQKEGTLEECYFSYDEARSTQDTMENRFVKYTLQSIGRRLSQVIETVLSKTQEDLSERHRQQWIDYQNVLRKMQKHPFFKGVGKFDGLKQESLVLQNRAGYQQIYKDWLKLKRGIDLYHGAANIGTLQIWEIYELWCFIKMKKMVAKVMGINRNDPDYELLVTEPKGTLLNPFTDSSLEHVVKFRYPAPQEEDDEERKAQLLAHKDDIVTLHYQHTFNRRSGGGEYGMGIHTATTEQRPDIVLNISKDSGETLLTYLYDAKYRVINDKILDTDFEKQDIDEDAELGGKGGDYPPTDAINQMHRYRDAIYYSKEHEPYRSKEIIGGYILFPGRGDDEYISQRYFSTSVEEVNIGAFPLLPNANEELEGRLLKQHLHKILIEHVTTESHVSKAKPQRTLAYVSEEEKAGVVDDLVMIAVAGNEEKRNWTLENCWYNIPLEKMADSPIMQAKYLLLHVKGETEVGNIRKIVKSRHDVWSKEKLTNEGYSKPGNPFYYMLRIRKEDGTDESIRYKVFDLKNTPAIVWGTPQMPFYFVRLKDLNAKE